MRSAQRFWRRQSRLRGRVNSMVVGIIVSLAFMPVAVRGATGSSTVPDSGVITPFGVVPKSDVLGVPNGTLIEDGKSMVLPNGEDVALPHNSGAKPPVDSGWIEDAFWTYSSSGYSIGDFSASWNLPSDPSIYSSQIIYLFPGLEPNPNPSAIIIQPVLQWGNNSYFGGNYWTMASWYVQGNTFLYSTPMRVSYSDLSGEMSGSSCQSSNGECDWTVSAIQFQNGQGLGTTLYYTGHSQLDNLAMYSSAVTLEAYKISSCGEFPQSSITFSDLFFASDVPPWQYPTPSWNYQVNYNDCGESVIINSPSSVTLVA
jgi:hypothetical protein